MCATDTIYVHYNQKYKIKYKVDGYFKNGGKKNNIDSQDCNNNGPVKPVYTQKVIARYQLPPLLNKMFIFFSFNLTLAGWGS